MPFIKPTKTPTYKTPLTAWVMALSLGLTACGGGGSSTSTSTPTPTPTPSDTPSATPTPSGTPSATPTPTPAAAPTPAPLVCAALGGSDGAPADQTCGLGGFQSELLASINNARSTGLNCGGEVMAPVCPVRWEGQLQAAANVHSVDMSTNNFFAHLSPTTGKTFRERLRDAGYFWTTGGENIAAGQTSASQVMSDWIGSPSHCKNLMQPAYRDVAVSCKSNAASTYNHYWTMNLGVR